MKVILVDDNKEFRKALTVILSNFKEIAIIGEVESGEAYLELLEKQIPDLVFMDVDLPGIDGAEATRKTMNMFRDVRIIALSFHDDFHYVKKMIEAGARNYYVKDKINRQVVAELINNIKKM